MQVRNVLLFNMLLELACFVLFVSHLTDTPETGAPHVWGCAQMKPDYFFVLFFFYFLFVRWFGDLGANHVIMSSESKK